MAVTGLAMDGGFEVGGYRQAQNAADAGALAAARQVFNGTSTCSTTDYNTLLADSNAEINHNRAHPGDASSDNQLNCIYQSVLIPPYSAHAAMATVSAGLTAGLSTVTANADVTESSATGTYRPVASGGSTASGSVDLTSVTATVTTLGIPTSAQGNLMCEQSSQGYPPPSPDVWSGESACSPNSLSAVSTLLGALGSITASAGVNLSPQSTSSYVGTAPMYMPESIGSNALTTVNESVLGTVVTASAANVVSQVGTSGTALAVNDLNLASVTTGLLTLSVSIPLVTMHAELDMTASGLVSAPTPTCVPGSLTIGATTYSFGSNCHITGLPASVAGVTLSDLSSDVVTTGCPGLNCSESGCFLQLSVVGSVAKVCIGEFDFSASGTLSTNPGGGGGGGGGGGAGNSPGTPGGAYTGSGIAVINGVQVEAHVDSPTFFMNVFGWRSTHPAATTTAEILQVADESDAAFSNAAYAMPDVATNMDCPCTTGPLNVGSEYYIYGSSMQSYSPVDAFPSTWNGRVSASSGHKVGSTLSSVTGTGSGPGTYVSGGNYYLLPVINPATAVVECYGVFRTVAGHSNWGQLVKNIPVQATASTVWSPAALGGAAAQTIKITQ